jgi:hypothetical protein
MPSRLNAPVLTVDVGLIHKVDTRNVENLFSMWTGECSFWNWVDRQRLTCCSVLKMRRFVGGGKKIREPELAIMEQGNILL